LTAQTTQAPPELDLSKLDNTGFLRINWPGPPPAERTLIVLGVARSGTTMVSGALHHLGIDMGMGGKPNTVYEDVALSEAVEGKDTNRLKSLIAQKNAERKVWGWKRPSAYEHIERVKRQFRNPEFLVIFRDVFAIANRNRISVRSDLLANMAHTVEQYRQLMAIISKSNERMALISYEKAMLNPGRFVGQLAAYAGVSDQKHIRAARRFVRETPADYLMTSRTWGGYGFLDRAEASFVSGWAMMRGTTEPVSIDVWINDQHAGTVLANQYRKDLAQKAHPTGECGFRLVLPDDRRLKEGDVVRVRIKGEVKDINNSPRTYVGKA